MPQTNQIRWCCSFVMQELLRDEHHIVWQCFCQTRKTFGDKRNFFGRRCRCNENKWIRKRFVHHRSSQKSSSNSTTSRFILALCLLDKNAVFTTNYQSFPNTGCISIGRTGSDTNIGFVYGFIDTPIIIRERSAMNHKLDRAIEDRSTTLRTVCHNGKGWACCLGINFVCVFSFFLNINCCIDGVIISCYWLKHSQIPGWAMVALALDEFSAIRISEKGSIVVDACVVARHYFFSAAIVDGDWPNLVFDFDIRDSFHDPYCSLYPWFFILRVDFYSDRGVNNRCILCRDDLQFLGWSAWSKDIGTGIVVIAIVYGVFLLIVGSVISPRAQVFDLLCSYLTNVTGLGIYYDRKMPIGYFHRTIIPLIKFVLRLIRRWIQPSLAKHRGDGVIVLLDAEHLCTHRRK
mmetsp:Transcript_3921/g.8189  ORF Transcript_3921/g.8189 Transcript_3921/m.8189 type:complete len:404 (-) Transcript_3921:177-1388(-)